MNGGMGLYKQRYKDIKTVGRNKKVTVFMLDDYNLNDELLKKNESYVVEISVAETLKALGIAI